MVFSVVMCVCESWTIKKAECRKIDAFEPWCWKRLESPLNCEEIQPVHPKGNQSWIFIGRADTEAEAPILATWCEEVTHWKRPWCWERVKAGGEGDDKGWDGWMASPTRWTWVWASSRSWWWTGKAGVLQSMGSQRVGHNWVIRTSFSSKMTGLFYSLTFKNNILLKSNFERTLWFWPLCPQTRSLPFLCPPSSAVASVAHSPEAPVLSSAPVVWPS